LPLLNAKLQPEMIDFIKEEVTMQLNLKVCNEHSVFHEHDPLFRTWRSSIGVHMINALFFTYVRTNEIKIIIDKFDLIFYPPFSSLSLVRFAICMTIRNY
jgi:hypothetical protein